MSTVQELLREASQLPSDQRLTLAHRLMLLDEPQQSGEVDKAWDNLIRERIDRYDRGDLKGIPAADVFSDLDRRLKK
jgi:hypothetical protein